MKKGKIIVTISIILIGLMFCIWWWYDKLPPSYKDIPLSITNGDGIVLDTDDFFFTNKYENFTLLLGMNKKECLSITGEGSREIYLFTSEHSYGGYVLFFGKKLDNITVFNDVYFKFKNWETYKGINFNTTKKETIEIFGEPTHSIIPSNEYEIEYKLFYIFYKMENGKYKKLKDKEEVELVVANKKHAREMRMFSFDYSTRKGEMLSFDLGYLSSDGDSDSHGGWRHATGTEKD